MIKYFCDVCGNEVPSNTAFVRFEDKPKPHGIKDFCGDCGLWWSGQLENLDELVRSFKENLFKTELEKFRKGG